MLLSSFAFFKTFDGIEINTTLRVSIWLEEKDTYLMPCQFIEVLQEKDFYAIKVEVLDPNNFMQEKHLDKRFFFGHPGKIIGYGILKELVRNL